MTETDITFWGYHMKVFVTGASGWIGSACVDELLAHGHQVVGLARSDSSADALAAKGADVQRGELDDLDSLRAGTVGADAVVHLANKHDFADMAGSNRAERAAVQTLGDALVGTDHTLLIASGAGGGLVLESDASPAHGPDSMRGGGENLLLSFAERGVRTISARFPPTVHGTGDHGFVSTLVDVARERGTSAYVGDGTARWSAVHVSDAAVLVRLALEQAPASAVLHAVAEEGVPTREVAELIGRALDLPVTSVAPDAAAAHFGWIGMFFAMDRGASSEATRAAFGWTPTGPTLAEDLASGSYTS